MPIEKEQFGEDFIVYNLKVDGGAIPVLNQSNQINVCADARNTGEVVSGYILAAFGSNEEKNMTSKLLKPENKKIFQEGFPIV